MSNDRINEVMSAKAAEREAKRQAAQAERTRQQRLDATAQAGGWVIVLIIAAGLAAVVSGALWWLALFIWTNLPV